MPKIITMTAYRRPDYTRQVLAALAACEGIADWLLLPSIEPGCGETIEQFSAWSACEIQPQINHDRLGLNRNTHAALSRALAFDPACVVHLEDDTVPSTDALRYFEWAVSDVLPRKGAEEVLLASGYNRPETEPTDDESHQCSTRSIFTPWGWATDAKHLRWILQKWCFKDPRCFTCSFRQYWSRSRLEVFPRLSRIQNIGYELGENERTPAWYREHHRAPWVAGSLPPRPFSVEINKDSLSMSKRDLLKRLSAGGETVVVPPDRRPAWDATPDMETMAPAGAWWAEMETAAAELPAATQFSTPESSGPFVNPKGGDAGLENLFLGGTAFVVLSGPSILRLDLSLLRRRGVFTIGVNNSPAIFRPNAWVHVDPNHKFHDAIWRDPAVLKFVPSRYVGKNLRGKRPDGSFYFLQLDGRDLESREMPGVVGYRRNAYYDPAAWLSEPTINWGNSKRSAKRNGRPRILNVMLATIKIAYALGFRQVFLLGCDFNMTTAQPYAFEQRKSAGGVNGNQNTYRLLQSMFDELQPSFKQAGLNIYNCNPKSCLQSFLYMPYSEAIERATSSVPQDPLDTQGWYDK